MSSSNMLISPHPAQKADDNDRHMEADIWPVWTLVRERKKMAAQLHNVT